MSTDKLRQPQKTNQPPIDDEMQPIETVVKSKSATNFNGFKAPLHGGTIVDIDDQLLCFDVANGSWTKVRMNRDDRLRRFDETLTNRHGMSSIKKKRMHSFIHSRPTTLHEMLKQ